MAMSRSFTESGSDEIRDVSVETCSICAIDGKLQPATHFCFDCGVYGRCICGDCLRKHNIIVGNHAVEIIAIQPNSKWKRLEKELSEERQKAKIQTTLAKDRERRINELEEESDMLNKELAKERELSRIRGEELSEHQKECKTKREDVLVLTKRNDDLHNFMSRKEKEVNEKQERIFTMEKQLEQSHAAEMKLQGRLQDQSKSYNELMKKSEEMYEENIKLTKEKKHLEKKYDSTMVSVSETMAEEKRKHDSEMQKLTRERDDIRDRFNKLACANQNADIADLSDPNRAMKLSEKFGSIYDVEWTNAFEALTDKKIGLPLKGAIVLQLKLLQDSWTFCSDLLGTQMESLHNMFLHPAQDLSKIDPQQNVAGHKDRPRICSKDEKTLREVRRQICVGSSVIEEVKQVFLSDIKSRGKEKTGYQKKHIEECAPYILKCAEICWLMAVHDPPLYMKMDVKHGEKFDPNIYSAYSSSGTSIDFLVWPPLLNGKDGGLLAKGVAELLRTVGKKK